VPRFRFIESASQSSAIARQTRSDGIHEVKFDGYRSSSESATMRPSSSPGTGSISQPLSNDRSRSDHLVASSIEGVPEFYALDLRGKRLAPGRLCVWVFDVLEFNGIYLRPSRS